mgnify:CR=1 FL=1
MLDLRPLAVEGDWHDGGAAPGAVLAGIGALAAPGMGDDRRLVIAGQGRAVIEANLGIALTMGHRDQPRSTTACSACISIAGRSLPRRATRWRIPEQAFAVK